MSQRQRKVLATDKALDRLRLVDRLGQRLRGQVHRLEEHGLDDTALMIREHLEELHRAVTGMDEAVAQLVAVTEPGLDDTVPIGLRPPRS